MGPQKKPSNTEKQLAALKQTLQALRGEATEETLLETTLGYLQTEFDYALVWVGLYNHSKQSVVGKGGIAAAGDAAVLKQSFALKPGDLMEQVVIQQRLLSVPDLREEPRAGDWRRIAQKLGIQGTVIVPICHKDLCLGVILLGSALWGVSPRADETTRLSMVLSGLADALYQLEAERQRQQAKQPAEPLLMLLNRLRSLSQLDQRLAAIVQETQRFVGAERTNVYWFEPEHRSFWRRTGSREMGSSDPQNSRFTAQEANSFYQALAADQLVVIGEVQSSVKADMTAILMQRMRAQSLLAAPILLQDELFGFLAVEGTKPRIWSEEEKQYVRGAAQLIALTAPLDGMEKTIQQVKQDQLLTAETSYAIFDEQDWQDVLHKTSDRLTKRLQADRFLVLLYDRDQELFEVCYQTHAPNRRAIPTSLSSLNQIDWHMLERSTDAVSIENWEDDLKLMAWRSVFLENGVQSLLVCSTTIGHALEGLLMLGYETARTWSRAEREVLRIVSQQIGITIHQHELQRQTDQQQRVTQSIQNGLLSMQQTDALEQLEHAAMQQIAQVLNAPMATLVTWLPGRQAARISSAIVANPKFAINPNATPSTQTEVLIQWALQTDGLLPLSISDVSAETRQWLTGSDLGQLLVMALRTAPTHEATGMVIVGDRLDRYWPEHQLNALSTLTSQLAWSRRHLLITDEMMKQRAALERLNWYKQKRVEEVYRTLSVAVKRLNEMGAQKEAFSAVRYQQTLRHLGGILSNLSPVLKQEQWKLQHEYGTIALVSLLKHALERVDALIKQRQLWSQVHNDSNLDIAGDIPKIELVLNELLITACLRSPVGGRLDLWCRPLDNQWLELSITDNGEVEPRLIEELSQGPPKDPLLPSILDHPPGLHLAICQLLIKQLGGEFNLYHLEDGRILSRLLLPLSKPGKYAK